MSAANERLRPGELDGLVLAHMRRHKADGALTASAIAKATGRSSGAVANRLARLARKRTVRLAKRKPRAYVLDAQPPEALRPAEAFDVALGEPADRQGDALTVLPAELAEGLQGAGADLDPPLARVSQRSAPLRHLTRRSPPRSAPP